MKSPKVTVIIPNYNHARFLRRRLSTVLDQTYQDFEVLYLDDASTDNSSQIFAEFSTHPKIRAILNQKNSGSPFAQWNRGVREARGEFVWIAEADDYAAPDLLERLVEKLEQFPNAGMAYCQSLVVNENDQVIGQFPSALSSKRADWLKDFVMNGREVCSRYMLNENYIINASAVVFRKDIFVKAGFAEETMRLCGDWLTHTKMLTLSDLAYVASPLNYFRTHSHSVRRTTGTLRAAREVAIVQSFIRANTGSTERKRRTHMANFRQWLASIDSNQKYKSPKEAIAAFISQMKLDCAGCKTMLRSRAVHLLHDAGMLDRARTMLGR